MNHQILLLLFSLFSFTTNASKYPVVKRETSVSRVLEFHGAVLLKDGKQTSCELALMHSQAAFVPASCFDVGSSKSVNDVSPYQVAFDVGGSIIARDIVAVDRIIINPQYNPTTFANNIAVILFNSQLKEVWSNPIDRHPEELTDRAYVRRSMKSEDKQTWNAPAVINDMSTDDGCKQASALFESNPVDLWCTSKSVTSPVGGSCHVPYGVVYGLINSDMVVTAMYSHSAIYGSDLCGDSKAYHYYTVISNYLNWATGVVPNGFGIFSSDGSFTASSDPNYTVKNSDASSPSGVSLISGDMYARNAKVNPEVTPSTSTPSSTTTTTTTASSLSSSTSSGQSSEDSAEDSTEYSSEKSTKHTSEDSSEDTEEATKSNLHSKEASKSVGPTYAPSTSDTINQAAQSNSSSSLGTGQIIAMAVSIPVAMIIVIVVLFFLYKRWQRHKKTVAWDPNNENHTIRAIALDLNQPNMNSEHLPAYTSADSEDLAIFNFNRKN